MIATHRYLAIIAPPPPIAKEVVRIREALRALIGDFHGWKLMPHVTLFLADVPEEFGDLIATGIAAGVRHSKAFDLHYDGITHFPDEHTIYVDPLEKAAIGTLRTAIVDSVQAIGALKEYVRSTDHPHLTIAAGLRPGQFRSAWVMLTPHVFNAVHPVEHVVLLRRALRPGSEYEVLREFPLGK
ncbi:MAG: 2'-5' RNA ligase family protein [Flavobacteriales bacterium]|nr:2'-5' RNA ligase family protein [Flavobacteriales bacterium]